MLVIVIIGALLNREGAPNIAGFRILTVATGSMEPVLKTDSLILVKETPKEQLMVNDIITFKTKSGVLVTHRIVKVNENGDFTTKGDANNAEDIEKVEIAQIQGKVIFHISYLGRILLLLRQKLVFIVIILMGVLVIKNLEFRIKN